jgi:hypothetical protein
MAFRELPSRGIKAIVGSSAGAGGPRRLNHSSLSPHGAFDQYDPPMTPVLTDILCTKCGLCCDGTLFADVELVGLAEVARIEILGMEIENGDRNTGLLSQPCAALRGTRCGIYAHRPKCCRLFQCELLQSAQRGDITVERALEEIADTQEQIRRVRAMLDGLGSHDNGLPIKERCAETLAAEGPTAPEMVKARADLEAAMTALENTIWNTFLGSGQRR